MNMLMGHSRGSVLRRVRAAYASDGCRDLQPLSLRYTVRPAVTWQSRFIDAVSSPDFVAIAVFCAIGLLATINLLLRVPNVGIL